MSWYEDHLNVVAVRMAKKLREGHSEKSIYRFLFERGGWTEEETNKIIAKAKNICERKKAND